ncbi:hypothetical protein ACWD7F_14715 [Streptomyces sp. NPDC005122]
MNPYEMAPTKVPLSERIPREDRREPARLWRDIADEERHPERGEFTQRFPDAVGLAPEAGW